MSPRSFAAIFAVTGVLFFERIAYYAFRSSMFLRIRAESGMDIARVSSVSTAMTVLVLVGLAVGAGVSAFVRNRFVLAGVAVAIAAAHGVGAASPLVGAFPIAFLAGVVRPLAMLALAEELGRDGRMWWGTMVGAMYAVASNLAGTAGGLASALVGRETSFAALPVGFAFLGVVCAATAAIGFPGAPFEWARASDATVVPGPGLYRAEPVVVRSPGGPSPFVFVLVAVAAVTSAWEQNFHTNVLYRSAEIGKLPTVSPVVSCAFAAIVAAIAFALASSRSRVSATIPLGASLVGFALSAFVLVLGAVADVRALSVVSLLVDGVSDAVLLAVCVGYALAIPSSRHAGLAAAALSALFVVPTFFARLVPSHGDASVVVLAIAGVLTLAAGVTIAIAGPRVDPSPEPAPPPRT